MSIRLTPEVEAAIREHGASTYPHECCGLLLGRFDGDAKLATAAVVVENAWTPEEATLTDAEDQHSLRDRFYIPGPAYLRADREGRKQGLDIVGCYHSHPDDQARPSQRDLVGAAGLGDGPFFSYLVLSVQQGAPADLTSWLLRDGQWAEEPLERSF